MKLVVTLLVRDEEDIVADTISYHLDTGADLILVTDNGSVDSTREIVQSFVDEGAARLLMEPAPIHSQWRWVTRMARIAYWDHGADWVVNTDADEFWWPESGSLKDVLDAVDPRFSTVRVPRFDFRPLAGVGGGPRDTPYRETSSLRFIGGALEPKTCHRGASHVVVGQGNHEVTGVDGEEADGSGLLSVFHFPTRTREQFRSGVGNAGAAYKRSTEFVATTGEVKRALYASLERGGLDEIFESRELTKSEAAAALRSGEIVEDRRLMQALANPQNRDSHQNELVSASFDAAASELVVARLRGSGYRIRDIDIFESESSYDGADVLAFVPSPAEWVRHGTAGGADVEEVAYDWVRLIAAIGATASRALWIPSVAVNDPDTADVVASWIDGSTPKSLIEDTDESDRDFSASQGPALNLSRYVYSTLQADPGGFRPLARLLHAVAADGIVASRMGWYLGSPDAGTDLVGALKEQLAGAQASYDALRSRRSVRVALSVAEATKRLTRKDGRLQS